MPCSTSATTSSRSTRTGSTRCGVTRLPKFDRRVRRGPQHVRRRAPEPPRRHAPTSRPTLGELKTTFEFELFGTGVDEGQTTFRLRHAYGELGRFGAGQTWSPFTRPRRVPELARVLGPDGYAVVPQRAGSAGRPIKKERSRPDGRARAPGRERRPGRLRRPRRARRHSRAVSRCPTSRAPTSTRAGMGPRPRAPGILRRINWDDTLDDGLDLSGDATGWGLNLSCALKSRESSVLRMSFVVRRRHPERR